MTDTSTKADALAAERDALQKRVDELEVGWLPPPSLRQMLEDDRDTLQKQVKELETQLTTARNDAIDSLKSSEKFADELCTILGIKKPYATMDEMEAEK